jgi:endonuclease/exonuclease/phosphatase family metal-dependent hydrolase
MGTDRQAIFRVASLNLWFPGPDFDRRAELAPGRLNAMAEALGTLDADAVCLQEVWPGAAEVLAERLGFCGVSVVPPDPRSACGNAVISRSAMHDAGWIQLPHLDELQQPRTAAQALVTSSTGRIWSVLSTHLAFGSTSERTRLDQAQALDEHVGPAKDGDPIPVLCGDLNAIESSSTVRFLTGLEAHPSSPVSTQWIDAYAFAGEGPGETSSMENGAGREQAQRWGVDPSLVPDRRIDYVMVKGFRYGRVGCPVRCRRFLDQPRPVPHPPWPTDHFGLVVDLLDPGAVPPSSHAG